MNKTEIKNLLKETELFLGTPEPILDKIVEFTQYKQLKKGEFLINENSSSKHLYIIAKGHFSVSKSMDTEDIPDAQFILLERGATVGELSFLDEKPRSATVKALDDNCAALEIEKDQLTRLAPSSFYQQLGLLLSKRMRSSDETIIEKLKKELAQSTLMANMGKFITYILLLISFYNLALQGFIMLAGNPYTSMFASTSIIFVFTLVMLILVRHMNYPLSRCGVNLEDWQIVLPETLFFTLIAIGVITLIYWACFNLIFPGASFSLFHFQEIVKIYDTNNPAFHIWLFAGMIVYAVFVIFQEFISRGVLQSALEDFLQHKHKYLISNIVTSGVFASMHIHLSAILAGLVFIPSLFWGWLYIRHRSLLGPIFSHILIGWWAIFVLGIQDLFG